MLHQGLIVRVSLVVNNYDIDPKAVWNGLMGNRPQTVGQHPRTSHSANANRNAAAHPLWQSAELGYRMRDDVPTIEMRCHCNEIPRLQVTE
jgi:hypothetical protein